MNKNTDLVNYLSDRLVGLGDSVPEHIEECTIISEKETDYKNLIDIETLPDDIFVQPGIKVPNRKGFATYASYINTITEQKFGRPLILAMSADLSDSTNITIFKR